MSKTRKQDDVVQQERPVAAVEQDEQPSAMAAPVVDRALVAQLIGGAREQGLALDGEGGLLAQLTKLVLESALEGEITDHLGREKHERHGHDQPAAAFEHALHG